VRDRRFVAEHRGGPLTRRQHVALMNWACDCAAHVMHLCGTAIDGRLTEAFRVADEWRRGNASVGDARKASLGAIVTARESSNPVSISVARSVGHAVATAHMADHSLGAAWYALRAVEDAGDSVDSERRWQDDRLPRGIRKLVLSARSTRRDGG
jgi:hypothetical protein